MRRPALAALLVVATAAVLPARPVLADDAPTVSQKDRAFSVPGITVARGAVVHFVNADEFIHQVYVSAPAFSFESPEQDPGQSMDMRFPVAGTFTVRCHIHPKMSLTVTVR